MFANALILFLFTLFYKLLIRFETSRRVTEISMLPYNTILIYLIWELVELILLNIQTQRSWPEMIIEAAENMHLPYQRVYTVITFAKFYLFFVFVWHQLFEWVILITFI